MWNPHQIQRAPWGDTRYSRWQRHLSPQVKTGTNHQPYGSATMGTPSQPNSQENYGLSQHHAEEKSHPAVLTQSTYSEEKRRVLFFEATKFGVVCYTAKISKRMLNKWNNYFSPAMWKKAYVGVSFLALLRGFRDNMSHTAIQCQNTGVGG